MPTYHLQYFNVRGLAETSRFMFAVAKQEYTDARYNFTIDMKDGAPDFSTMKRPEFDAAKAAGDLDASGGKVPLLTIDGTQKIGQSKSIERYLASALGLAGSSAVEAAQVDQVTETVRDIKDAYQKVKGDAATKAKFFAEDLPTALGLMEKALPAGGSMLVGSKISYADICVYQLLAAPKGFFDDADKAKAAFSKCPRISAAMEATGANAELQAYIAKRPDTMM
jgi:glutathione S-transferase